MAAVTLAWLAWRSTRAGAPLSLDILAIVGPHISLYMGAKKLLLTVLPVLRDVADRVLTPTSGWTWLLMTAVWISVVALAARSASASNRTQLFGWLWMLAALVPVWWLPYQGRFTYLPSVGAALIAAGLLRDLDWRGRPAVAAGLAVLFLVCLTASAVSAVSWAGGGP